MARYMRRRDTEDFHEAMPAAAPAAAPRYAATDRPLVRRDPISRVIYFITAVVEVILGIRFLFLLLGASSANAVASFVYAISTPLVRPFYGIFNLSVPSHLGVSTFDWTTLVAMLVYAVIGYLLIALVRAIVGRPAV